MSSISIPIKLQIAAMNKYFPFHRSSYHELRIGKQYRYTNPFRPDNNASCYFDWFIPKEPNSTPVLNFYDYGATFDSKLVGNCVRIASTYFNISIKEAVRLILNDRELIFDRPFSHYDSSVRPFLIDSIHIDNDGKVTINNESVSLGSKITAKRIDELIRKNDKLVNWSIEARKWNLKDKEFWFDRYGITSSLLNKYKIVPVDKVFKIITNEDGVSSNSLHYSYDKAGTSDVCYCYQIEDRIKLYRPYNKTNKWMGTVKKADIQGYQQLIELINSKNCDQSLLVIASSMKDALCLISIGINAIAPQGESMLIEESVMIHLMESFDRVVILFDNDKAGINGASKYCDAYEHLKTRNNNKIEMAILPSHVCNDAKDVADFREKLGLEDFKQGIETLLDIYDY